MFDVAIIGCGPSGIFTALEILKHNANAKLVMFDKGKNINTRKCPKSKTLQCVACRPCNISCGWGGAGAFSDGKLSLNKDVGGWLEDYIGAEKLDTLINYVDDIYVGFGGTKEVIFNKEFADNFAYKCSSNNLKLVKCPVRHLGTEKTQIIMSKMYEKILSYKNVEIYDLAEVVNIKNNKTSKEIVVNINGKTEKFTSKNVVFSVGRSGSEWLQKTCDNLKIQVLPNQVDIGVRVELPRSITDFLTDELYEFKIYNTSKTSENVVRTFCMNPGGFVSQENYDDNLAVVNGHSFKDLKSDNTNFALLVSANFTEPFKEPIKYGKYIAKLGNMLTDGKIMVQRLKDLKAGKRSTYSKMKKLNFEPTLKDAVPGDLSFVLPHRILLALIETFEALDAVCPGINGDSTILYGVEVKFYSTKVKVNDKLMTDIDGIYAIGDGAGITRGLIQASISGVVVAEDIIKRL